MSCRFSWLFRLNLSPGSMAFRATQIGPFLDRDPFLAEDPTKLGPSGVFDPSPLAAAEGLVSWSRCLAAAAKPRSAQDCKMMVDQQG